MRNLLRILAGLLAIGVIVLPVVAVLNGWIGVERFPFRRLRIEGELNPGDAAEVRATLAPLTRRGFFATDLHKAQAALSTLPWVAHAEVRKRWPDEIDVKVDAQRPFAYWGKSQLVSDKGLLFPRNDGMVLPKGMPQLDGDPRNVADVLALYAKSRELFAATGIGVNTLAQDRRGSWNMVLSDGTQVVIGRNDAEARIERFAGLMPRLVAQQGRPLQRADLRYTNGFALVWSGAPAAGDRKPGAAKPAAPETTPAPALPAPLPLPTPIAFNADTSRIPFHVPLMAYRIS
ncbi:cell division protein FtsQ/DivIB [Solilutibacter silvestris]|uniref:Cell division protein FtsQ n=1 Tax=Solilutibacter silvestris TaxID=1645665 RepID=A0A2K1Q2N3_9GAMM|nr:cell division protein FtsQ/DivIB [Lysobacter silvestris]PNS09284.1 Cell division septal protein [Lysobacter silvestris]